MKNEINSKTSLYGLVGNPVYHSYSPLIYNFLFNYYSINSVYLAFNVKEPQLDKAMYGLKTIGVRGINITSPYKGKALKYIDDIDATAADIGNINTIKNMQGRFIGYNTDYYGIMQTFELENINLEGKKALLIGAGEVAKTICFALEILGAEEVIILNRTVEKAKKISNDFKKRRILIKYGELNTTKVNACIEDADLIVNATNVDLLDKEIIKINFDLVKNNTVFFDVLYNPIQTLLLKQANLKGFRTVNGISMLIFQALKTFEIWTKIDVEKNMYEKIFRRIINVV